MRPASRKLATYEDLKALPEGVLGQIVAGELIATPRPAIAHTQVASILGMDIGGAFQRGRGGPGGWWILDEPELHFGGDILVPDLAGWRRERMPQPPREAFLTLAPDWICEVLSPSTAVIDRVRKLRIYGREGVSHAWIVDPSCRSLEIFRRVEENWLLVAAYADNDKVRAEPFDAIELDLAALWLS